jgi:hypothetical protein
MRSAVAGMTRFDFLTSLYPKMNIKYSGIPGPLGVRFPLGITNV